MDTEQISTENAQLDTLPTGSILQRLVDSNRLAVEAVAAALPQLEAAADLIRPRLERGGRLVYIGAGTSGRLAVQDAAELKPTFGFTRTLVLMAGGEAAGSQALEGAEDDSGAAAREVAEAGIGPDDAVIGIAASGRTPYTVAGLRVARERGAATVGIANNPGTLLLEAAEVPVLIQTGAEVLAGSTRLAAGTAQKIVLNSLSTTVLVQLGGAYSNLMVGMQPTNAKLRERAVVIVAHAGDATAEQAAAVLEQAGWDMRTAIVMLRAGVSRTEAEAALGAAGNRVRQALEAL